MSKLLLNIITPVSKIENLELLQQNLLRIVDFSRISIHWYILCDKKLEFIPKLPFTQISSSFSRNEQVNHALDRIGDGYVYFLFDNNLMHPDLISTFLEEEPCDGIIVEQILEDASIRHLKVDMGNRRVPKIKPGSIDAAQIIFSREIIGETRWHLDVNDADGYFIERLYDEHADKIKLIEKPLAYYRKLDEYQILSQSPQNFEIGSIVTPDKKYFEENIKGSLNPILRGTITLLSRCCGRKFKVLDLKKTTINLLPLREASVEYRRGSGVVLVFETEEHLQKCFKVLEWQNSLLA